jgi:phytoene desaturase
MNDNRHNTRKIAAVIGSGFGGLAAAIRLQAGGAQTTLFEKRDKPGGRAYVYERDGFTFDAGPTVITVPDTIRELFTLGNKRMEDYIKLIPVQPFYRLFWEDGVKFDYSNNEEDLKRQFDELAPGDWEGYQKFLRYAEDVYQEGYVRLGHVPFLKIWDMIKVAPQLLRLKAILPVYATVSRYIKNDYLRQALTFNSLLIGGNPFEISSIYTLIHPLEKKFGVHFPVGGTHALVRSLVQLFEDLGGELRCDADVRRITTTASGRVTGLKVNDEVFPCDIVISNADVQHTYRHLLADHLPSVKSANAIERKNYSMSLFVIYFGTNKDFSNLVHHNIFFGARYKELLSEIFGSSKIADDFSIYLHAPSKTDPSMSPPGHFSYYALVPVPNLSVAPIDWSKFADEYADRILKYLDERYMPGLRASIVTKHYLTPEGFRDELNSHVGAAFSLTPKLTQSAWFRVHNRDDKVKGLYFVGAGTHPGAGVPGVICSAKATCGVVAEDYGLRGFP